MTLAEAIVRAKAGEQDGFICLFWHTVPHVWLAAAMLGCPKPGEAVVQIYRDAQASVQALRSPSDLRVWIGTQSYAFLLRQEEGKGTGIPALAEQPQAAYQLMCELPRLERLALLLLCGEGCSAPQASEILSQPEIEIKRALRRARQTISEQMQDTHPSVSCNMNGLIDLLAQMREAQTQADRARLQEMLHCVQTGEAYVEPEQAVLQPIAVDHAETEDKSEEKSGFFQKLFRSHRFG